MTLDIYDFSDHEVSPLWSERFSSPFDPGASTSTMSHPFVEMAQEFVRIPEPEVQLPWIAAYLLSCTGMLKAAKSKVPYLFSYGGSRSGKSRIAKFAASISTSQVCNAGSSPASIRQEIERYHANDQRYFFFLWDDISKDMLTGTNGSMIFSFLKGGYDATTSMVMVGGRDGDPVQFDTFGLKLFSSCTPLHRLSQFVELSNRMLVVQHESIPGFIGSDPSDWRWDGFAVLAEKFWSPAGDGYRRFKTYRPIIHKMLKDEAIGVPMGKKKTIFKDLIACACALGLFPSGGTRSDDVELAVHWADKFCLYEARTYAESSPLTQWLVETIIELGETFDHVDDSTKRVHIVPAKKLRERAQIDFEECLLLTKPSMDEIQSLLEPMGYSLTGKSVYCKTASYKREFVCPH